MVWRSRGSRAKALTSRSLLKRSDYCVGVALGGKGNITMVLLCIKFF